MERLDVKKAYNEKVCEITYENGFPQIVIFFEAFSIPFDNIELSLDVLEHRVDKLLKCLKDKFQLEINFKFLPYKEFVFKCKQFYDLFQELQKMYTEFEVRLIDLLIEKRIFFVDHSD